MQVYFECICWMFAQCLLDRVKCKRGIMLNVTAIAWQWDRYFVPQNVFLVCDKIAIIYAQLVTLNAGLADVHHKLRA